MQIFLDTADIDAVRELVPLGVIRGLTTNPTLIAKEGVPVRPRIMELADLVQGPTSVEVIATDTTGMVSQGRQIASWHEHFVVKLPLTAQGIEACHILSSEGIRTNVTLVFSVSQAVLAAQAGATYVSPFLGRVDDISSDAESLIADICEAFALHNLSTQVLAASLRSPGHYLMALRVGADVCTLPPSLLTKLLQHPQTDLGLQAFLEDFASCQECQEMFDQ